MAYPRSALQLLCSLLFFLACAEALKFDIQAYSKGDKKGERCIRNFVGKDTLVVVTATVGGYKGDGMKVDMHVSANLQAEIRLNCMLIVCWQIKDAVGNEYGRPKDVVGEQRMAFTSHADASFDVCFTNEYSGCAHSLVPTSSAPTDQCYSQGCQGSQPTH